MPTGQPNTDSPRLRRSSWAIQDCVQLAAKADHHGKAIYPKWASVIHSLPSVGHISYLLLL